MKAGAGLARILPALAAAAALILASSATRVALALRPELRTLDALDVARAFALGTLFDFAAAACAVLPLVLWLLLAPDRVARSRIHRAGTLAGFFLLCFVALVVPLAEWLFWDEFGARFNFIAVDYLLYTHEVLGNVWESYPTGKLLVAIALAATAITGALARRLWRWSAAPLAWRGAFGVLAAHALVVAVAVTLVDSDWKVHARSDGANELSGNGMYDFFAALRRNELNFERFYATLPDPEALAMVRGALSPASWINEQAPGLERLQDGAAAEKHLNVILVSVESLGAEFLGAYGNARGLTPNLDRLARESLWFSRVYATGNRTVRGLEALSLALPPTPGQSIVRRPHNEHLFSLGSVFEDKGYAVLFAYGGYGYFDNMNAFFVANDYKVSDRRNIPAKDIEFQNVWGVADEHLFDHVLDEIDRARAARPRQPVFAHVMTTSNHRPYTYPPGRIDIASRSGRDGAVKYSDYALGRLIESARERAWFDDTVFVITADHGANARGTSRIPVDKYLIPVFVYAPRHIAPRRVDRLMSQIDIAPTILGLLDFRYYTKFLGRDVLRAAPESDRAFVANFQTLGYLKDDRMVVLQPRRKVEWLRQAGADYVADSDSDPALAREAISFYQVASRAFRSGWYRDEEQLPPNERVAFRMRGVAN